MIKSEHPLISVIVPVYNVKHYLRDCVNSLLNQTYSRLEIILVDDYSTDGSGELCDELAQQDVRITVQHLPVNGGPGNARNVGLKCATGEYVGFVDGDDWLDPDMYEFLWSLSEKHSADISMCSFYIEKPNRIKVSYTSDKALVLNRGEAMELLIADRIIRNYMWDKLYKRSLFQDIQFPSTFIYEDLTIQYKLFYQAKLIAIQGEPKYHYRMNGASIMAQKHDVEEEYRLFKIMVERNLFVRHIMKPEFGDVQMLKRCIHFISHLALMRHRQLTDDIYQSVLQEMHNYDSIKIDKLGVMFALKRFLIYHYPSLYRPVYRFVRSVFRSKKRPVEK